MGSHKDIAPQGEKIGAGPIGGILYEKLHNPVF